MPWICRDLGSFHGPSGWGSLVVLSLIVILDDLVKL